MAETLIFRLEWRTQAGSAVEIIEFPWMDAEYDPANTGGEMKVRELKGNAGVARFVSRPILKHGTLKGSGVISDTGLGIVTDGEEAGGADPAKARRIIEITRGFDTTQPWHTFNVFFEDLRGMRWKVVPKMFDVEWPQGWGGDAKFKFEFPIESAPAIFKTPCTA